LEKLNASENDKERIRDEVIRLVDLKMSERVGAIRIDSPSVTDEEKDDQEALEELERIKVYERLVECLLRGDTKTFDEHVYSVAKNVYDAEKIKRNAKKRMQESLMIMKK